MMYKQLLSLLVILQLFAGNVVAVPVTVADEATAASLKKKDTDGTSTTEGFLRSGLSRSSASYEVEPDVRDLIEVSSMITPTVSSYFQWESIMWPQRNLKANVTLDVEAFEIALLEASDNNCDLGITATLFNQNAEQIYQQTVGSKYHALGTSEEPYVDGWTENTTFALYSNSKILAASLFMASIVDTDRGYLDEPLYKTYEYLNETDRVGKVTPRMILSHRSGIRKYERFDDQDPFYQCIYNETTLLRACVQEFLLKDDALIEEPGTTVRYNNEPFYILADFILRKTGYDDFDQLLKEYITEPLGMNDTTYNCPLVGSTGTKPHVSWGICSTGKDIPKLIQVLANGGTSPDSNGTKILSADSVRQILNDQIGIAVNADAPLQGDVPLGNCMGRTNDGYTNALIGYGLGTMITAGTKGQLFVHAGSTGGYWVIAPGRFSAYFAWMQRGGWQTYANMARVIDKLERASTFLVSNSFEENSWNEITPCIDGMFMESDFLDQYVAGGSSCR